MTTFNSDATFFFSHQNCIIHRNGIIHRLRRCQAQSRNICIIYPQISFRLQRIFCLFKRTCREEKPSIKSSFFHIYNKNVSFLLVSHLLRYIKCICVKCLMNSSRKCVLCDTNFLNFLELSSCSNACTTLIIFHKA